MGIARQVSGPVLGNRRRPANGEAGASIIQRFAFLLSMTNTALPDVGWHSIAAVERDTGLAKDTLRVWERRYGYPQPRRDAQGERLYSDDDLARLRHIRRLIDSGHRPGRVVPLPLETLITLGTGEAAARIQSRGLPPLDEERQQQWLSLLRRQDAPGLRQAITGQLNERGLARTVSEVIAPMTVHVGQAWLEGTVAVYEEHLYTEVVQQSLRHAIAQVAGARPLRPPRVLLTTVPGEVHALGLLMAECFLALESCQTLPLGVQTPLADIARAVETSGADVVALSFSTMQTPREARASLEQLRLRLPASVEIWAGGQCPAVRRGPLGGPARPWWPMPRLQDIPVAVARWRAESARRARTP